MAVHRAKQLEQPAEGGIIGEVLPFEQGTDHRIGPEDSQMTHMLGPGNHPHGQHHDTIGYRELGSAASDKRDALFEHSVEVKFFGELSQVDQSGVAGKIFLGKLNMISSHGFYASLCS